MGSATRGPIKKPASRRTAKPRALKPVRLKLVYTRQFDGFTCGYCACSAIYRYYKMNIRVWELRKRLGVDNVVPPILPGRFREWADATFDGAKGTLPFDVFATLHRHGFDLKWTTAPYATARGELHRHLLRGHPALAIWGHKLEHWIAVEGIDDEGVWVVDSAKGYSFSQAGTGSEYKGRIPHAEFGAHVTGMILVKRLKSSRPRYMTPPMYLEQYRRAAVFGAGCLGKAIPRQIGALKTWLMMR